MLNQAANGFGASHRDIDFYTPTDMYPERNRQEHAMLSATIAHRDAGINPQREALNAAESRALEAVVNTIPTTLEGALAMLKAV